MKSTYLFRSELSERIHDAIGTDSNFTAYTALCEVRTVLNYAHTVLTKNELYDLAKRGADAIDGRDLSEEATCTLAEFATLHYDFTTLMKNSA